MARTRVETVPEPEALFLCLSVRQIRSIDSQQEIEPWTRQREAGVLLDTPASAQMTKI